MVPLTLGQTRPPPTPCYRARASWALESDSSAPRDDLAPKFSSSSPCPSHSPATGLQTAHGDTPNIHPEATSNRGSIKRTCTIQEVSTAAHSEQDINTDHSLKTWKRKKKQKQTSDKKLMLQHSCPQEALRHIPSWKRMSYRYTISKGGNALAPLFCSQEQGGNGW